MNYYAVERSSDHLAHYGVKGMKWGVRRAIKHKNDKALNRHYNKALKKLAELDLYANLDIQKQMAAKHSKAASSYKRAADRAKSIASYNPQKDPSKHYQNMYRGLEVLNNKKVRKALMRMTPEGHAKAVAERDKFQMEMKKAFSGTKYVNNKKRRASIMHNDHYGTLFISTSNYLAHYGVKGMKWGVRKAIENKNERKLDRQYRKAKKKLEKLNTKADIDMQKIAASKHAKRAAIAAGISGAAMGINYKSNIDYRKKAAQSGVQHVANPIATPRRKNIVGEGKGIKKHGNGLISEYLNADKVETPSAYISHPAFNPDANKMPSYANTKKSSGRQLSALGVIGLAGLGTAAYQAGKSIAAKYRTTNKGHAKAVAKRDAWRKEMNAAFKGTKYDQNRRRKSK